MSLHAYKFILTISAFFILFGVLSLIPNSNETRYLDLPNLDKDKLLIELNRIDLEHLKKNVLVNNDAPQVAVLGGHMSRHHSQQGISKFGVSSFFNYWGKNGLDTALLKLKGMEKRGYLPSLAIVEVMPPAGHNAPSNLTPPSEIGKSENQKGFGIFFSNIDRFIRSALSYENIILRISTLGIEPQFIIVDEAKCRDQLNKANTHSTLPLRLLRDWGLLEHSNSCNYSRALKHREHMLRFDGSVPELTKREIAKHPPKSNLTIEEATAIADKILLLREWGKERNVNIVFQIPPVYGIHKSEAHKLLLNALNAIGTFDIFDNFGKSYDQSYFISNWDHTSNKYFTLLFSQIIKRDFFQQSNKGKI